MSSSSLISEAAAAPGTLAGPVSPITSTGRTAVDVYICSFECKGRGLTVLQKGELSADIASSAHLIVVYLCKVVTGVMNPPSSR